TTEARVADPGAHAFGLERRADEGSGRAAECLRLDRHDVAIEAAPVHPLVDLERPNTGDSPDHGLEVGRVLGPLGDLRLEPVELVEQQRGVELAQPGVGYERDAPP